MEYYQNKHHRRSIRLKGFDYSQAGLYFITFCVQNRKCLFGDITNGKTKLNNAERIVENKWLALPQRFTNIHLHEYIAMPNHFHAIMQIVGATLVVAPNKPIAKIKKGQRQGFAPMGNPNKKTVSDMVSAFQSIATLEYIRGVKNHNWQRFNKILWQRNYWKHIIRNGAECNRIANYIINNPRKWINDKLNPGNP